MRSRGLTTSHPADRFGRGGRWLRRSVLAAALLGAVGTAGALPLAPAWADESAAAAPATPAPALEMSEQERDRAAEAIARSIMSPFCPGRTVSSCPNAGPWREDIRRWVGEGVDALEIRRRLAERVPEHNLMGVPTNRLGWVLPVGLGILAVGALVFVLWYLVQRTPKGTSSKPAADETPSKGEATGGTSPVRAKTEDWDARLEQELETLEN